MNNAIQAQIVKKKKRSNGRDVHHNEAITMLHDYGAFTRSQESGKFSQTEPGSADIILNLGGRGCAIEVKTAFNGSFDFSNWRENQRTWMKDYEAKTKCIYWLNIWFETKFCPWSSLRKPRVPFLIPGFVVELESENFPQSSIPYIADKGMLLEIQQRRLDANRLWGDFSLSFENGKWIVPQGHLFFDLYLKEN